MTNYYYKEDNSQKENITSKKLLFSTPSDTQSLSDKETNIIELPNCEMYWAKDVRLAVLKLKEEIGGYDLIGSNEVFKIIENIFGDKLTR